MKIRTTHLQQLFSPHEVVRAEATRCASELLATSLPLGGKEPVIATADKKQMREDRKLAAFVRELAVIKAQCDAGMEPSISIAATCFISKRSHATVYRDIQKRVLPAPMKVGRSSMLPFSVVKAYAAGALVGDVA
ncbi:hypothetical protein [Acidovorax sp. LjRoot117]|uniref:hypothetical protein n=1 Tax=Acidovorax sp. LjRoot117 TaxID=3342255 RepID=UPI003ED11B53